MNPLKTKANKSDFIIVALSLIFLIVAYFGLLFNNHASENAKVLVYIGNNKVGEYALNTNIQVTYLKTKYPSELVDDLTIEIKEKKIRVLYEDSPKHVCSSQGFISIPNYPLICAPNHTRIIIKGSSGGLFV
jgi:hypothetical protein